MKDRWGRDEQGMGKSAMVAGMAAVLGFRRWIAGGCGPRLGRGSSGCEARHRGEPGRQEAGARGRRTGEEGLYRRGWQPSTPSPTGTFTIARRVKNPTYSHDGKTVLPGPGNPVGTRWMGLNIKGYGIHGTNEPRSIGKAASHGCIRMAKKDLEEMYEMVSVGDSVELVGQPNEETAQLFGGDQKPVVTGAQEPVVTASLAPAPTTTATEATAEGIAVTGNW